MDRATAIVGTMIERGSLAAVVTAWRRPERVLANVLWTLGVLVPVLGLVVWAIAGDAPPPSRWTDRAPPAREWDLPPRGGL